MLIIVVCILAAALVAERNRRRCMAERVEEDLRTCQRDILALGAISAAIGGTLDPDEVLQRAIEQVLAITNADGVAVYLLEDNAYIRVAASLRRTGSEYPAPPERVPLKGSLSSLAIEQGRGILVVDPADRFATVPDHFRTVAAVPIVSHDKAVGTIVVVYLKRMESDPFEMAVLEGIGRQVGTALENARLHAEERRQRRIADTLREAAGIVGSTLDLDEAINALLAQLSRVIHYDSASVMLLSPAGRLEFQAAVGYEQGTAEPGTGFYPSEVPSLQHLLDTRSPVLIADTTECESWVPRPESRRIRSWIGVPLVVRGAPIGVLNVDSFSPGAYTEGDVRVVEMFAGQAAIAIDNARLFRTEQIRLARAETLHKIAVLLTSTLDLDEAINRALELLGEVLDYDKATVFLFEGERFSAKASRGFDTPEILDGAYPIDDVPTMAWLRSHREKLLLKDTWQSPIWRRDILGGTPIRSWIGAPLIGRDRVLGAICVDGMEPNKFCEDDAQIVQTLANYLAAAIENATLVGEITTLYKDLQKLVTERTAEIREQKERTEAILQSVADAVIVFDLDGQIVMTNPVADGLINHPDPEVSEGVREFIKSLTSGSTLAETGILELENLVLQAKASRVIENDREIGIVVVLRDITRLRELDKLKDHFVSTVSHELRTPLANIKLYLFLLRHGKPERRDNYFKIMEQETTRLERLVRDLLDISRLQERRIPTRLEPLDLSGVIISVVESHTPLAETKGVHLSFQSQAARHQSIKADRGQMIQVFTNLISNAIMYTPPDGQVYVILREQERFGRNGVAVEVIDTGVGIPEEDMPHIFDRFYRGSNAEGAPGTGLGLAIVKEIIALYEGVIEVESKPGQGSKFSVWLPGYTEGETDG